MTVNSQHLLALLDSTFNECLAEFILLHYTVTQNILRSISCSLLTRQVHSLAVIVANTSLISKGRVLNSDAGSVFSFLK